MTRALPPGRSFIPIVEVDGRPRLGSQHGCAPRLDDSIVDGGWLLSSFRRPVPAGPHWIRTVLHRDRVLGFTTGPRSCQISTAQCRSIAQGLDPRHGIRDGGVALVDAQGNLLSATDAVHRPSLTGAIRAALAANTPVTVDGWWVEVRTLTGSGRRRDLLARYEPARAVQVPLFAQLTDGQAEVCFLAAKGLSAQEIGEIRRCRTETVRSHLRASYRRLGVSTRAELVPVLTELNHWLDRVVPELVRRWLPQHEPLQSERSP